MWPGARLIRFKLDLVRVPDVSFIRWDSVDDPNEIENPAGAFLEYPPDLAIEVLSPGNTRGEMAIKLEEYAKAGVKLVWYVDPERKEVDVYPKGNPKRKKTLGMNDTLEGEHRVARVRSEGGADIREPAQSPFEAEEGAGEEARRSRIGLDVHQHLRMTPASTPRMRTSCLVGSTMIGSIVLFIGSSRIWFFFL